MHFASLVSLALAVQTTVAIPTHGESALLREAPSLDFEYDFIVVGGGTAGLTVADRLTENGRYTVLVVEYGYLDDNPSILATGGDRAKVPPNPVYPLATQTYNITTLPILGLAGKNVTVMAAAIVGGSSAINGFAFDRGTAEDYEGWVWQAGESEYEAEWGWNNMYPWFKKGVAFHPPSPQLAEELQITWDLAAWGENGSLHAGFSPFQWKQQQAIFNAFKTMPGVQMPKEGADGNATGVFWFPNTINPSDQRRSHARTAHYDPVMARHNYHLLPGWRVTQVTMSRDSDASDWAANGVLITPRDGEMPKDGPLKIKAKREVIVSAGTIHTPQVLQRSGIGPRQVIEAAGGTVRIELPGVGFNLQDHMYFPVNFTWGTPVYPDPTNLTTNATFAAEAAAIWAANKTGPLSNHVNTAAFLPFSIMTNENRTDEILSAIEEQLSYPQAYLPNDTHPTILEGYVEQLKVLGQLYGSQGSAVIEFPFSGNSLFYPILIKPLSRGTVYLDPKDDGVDPMGRGNMEPLVDYRTLSNPVDTETTADLLRWIRRFMASDVMQSTFHPRETAPGANITSEEDIQHYIATSGTPGNGHPSGTARLAPRDVGGVLAADLTVHGVKGLSVADCSVFPLIPGTHTSSTAYAVAEKAADMILKRAN